jgi:hypothetical protein
MLLMFSGLALSVQLTLGGQPILDKIPQWVLNPTVENGIAAADCVVLKGNILKARRQAQHGALFELAKQLDGRLNVLEKAYGVEYEVIPDNHEHEIVRQAITNEKLHSVRFLKSQRILIPIGDGSLAEHFCVLLALIP